MIKLTSGRMPKNTFIRAAAVSYPLSISAKKNPIRSHGKTVFPLNKILPKEASKYILDRCALRCAHILTNGHLKWRLSLKMKILNLVVVVKVKSSNIHICLEVFCCHKNLCFKYIDILANMPLLLKDMDSGLPPLSQIKEVEVS